MFFVEQASNKVSVPIMDCGLCRSIMYRYISKFWLYISKRNHHRHHMVLNHTIFYGNLDTIANLETWCVKFSPASKLPHILRLYQVILTTTSHSPIWHIQIIVYVQYWYMSSWISLMFCVFIGHEHNKYKLYAWYHTSCSKAPHVSISSLSQLGREHKDTMLHPVAGLVEYIIWYTVQLVSVLIPCNN